MRYLFVLDRRPSPRALSSPTIWPTKRWSMDIVLVAPPTARSTFSAAGYTDTSSSRACGSRPSRRNARTSRRRVRSSPSPRVVTSEARLPRWSRCGKSPACSSRIRAPSGASPSTGQAAALEPAWSPGPGGGLTTLTATNRPPIARRPRVWPAGTMTTSPARTAWAWSPAITWPIPSTIVITMSSGGAWRGISWPSSSAAITTRKRSVSASTLRPNSSVENSASSAARPTSGSDCLSAISDPLATENDPKIATAQRLSLVAEALRAHNLVERYRVKRREKLELLLRLQAADRAHDRVERLIPSGHHRPHIKCRHLIPPSHPPELARGALGHHFRHPSRLPDHLNGGMGDARDSQQSPLHSVRHAVAHRTAGSGEGHLDLDLAVLHVQSIDQAEIDEVDAELGVVHALELLPGFRGQQIVGQLEARLAHAVISCETR